MATTVELEPVEACELAGVDVVTQSAISDAAGLIERDTGLTVVQWVDDVVTPVGLVKRAWSIVAARLHMYSSNTGGEALTGETQGDYSYSLDVGTRAQFVADPLHGLPRTLLGEATGEMVSLRPGQSLVGPRR